MNSVNFSRACLGAVEELRRLCPKDTGNLAYNAIRYKWEDPDTFQIWIDESIAPYMPYTNEPWKSPFWRGKKNPNEGWFDRATEFIVNHIAREFKGEISHDTVADTGERTK